MSDLEDVYQHINNSCKNLKILGLMTIGSYEQSTNSEEINIDFKVKKYLKNYIYVNYL